jgi:hypothetical protein
MVHALLAEEELAMPLIVKWSNSCKSLEVALHPL